MGTLTGTLIGFCFTIFFCCFVKVMFLCGFGEPNVLPECGETYVGWWLMLFGSTWIAFVILGMFMDTVFFVRKYIFGR